MKLNADVGEGLSKCSGTDDDLLFPYIHMANVACGGHASDPVTMQKTVRLAKHYGVEVGAHPSFPDRIGFGRRNLGLSNDEAALHMISQIGSLQAIAQQDSVRLAFVKPHGALYNQMMLDDDLLRTLMTNLAKLEINIPLMILGTMDFERHQEIARSEGITLLFEAFVDRNYGPDGRLMPRTEDASLIFNPGVMEERLAQYLDKQFLTCVDGSEIRAPVDTFCIHGDNPKSIEAIARLRALIDAS